MEKVVAGKGGLDRFDKARWLDTYAAGLRSYFRTLRNVRRFLSTSSFTINLFHSGSSFEVNPVDLIVLEVLRVFEPEVYRRTAAGKQRVTDTVNAEPTVRR